MLDSDRETAVRLLDQIAKLVQGALEANTDTSKKARLKGAGTVQFQRATVDEMLALVGQARTMLKRAQP